LPRKRYRIVGLPEQLYLRCVRIVKEELHGYSSVSEFVKDAVRRRLEQLEGEEKRRERISEEDPP